MPILCKWYQEGEYNNCTCHTILRLFSNRAIKCNGKPEPSKSGGGDLPTIKLLNSKGEIVDAYPCRSYRPRPEGSNCQDKGNEIRPNFVRCADARNEWS